MKKILQLVIFIIIIHQFLEAEDIITLNLKLNKDTYLVWEPIFEEHVIVNNSEDTTQYAYKSILDFEIRDSKGETYKYRVPMIVFDPSFYQYKISPPFDTITKYEFGNWDILSHFGKFPEAENGYYWYGIPWRSYLPPGKYTITANQKIRIKSRNVEKINVISSSQEFSVIEPTGMEKSAMQLFEEAVLLEGTISKQNHLEAKSRDKEALVKYIEIVEKYPNSIYAPLVLRRTQIKKNFDAGEGIEANKVAMEIARKIIDLYPNSHFAIMSLENILMYYANIREMDKSRIRNEIQKIIEKYPNTKVAKKAEKVLKEFDDGTSTYHKILEIKKCKGNKE